MDDLAEILTSKIPDVDAIRNVANCLMSYTEPRRHNGRGRGRSFAADTEAIATTARQLAEMVLLAVGGTTTGAGDLASPPENQSVLDNPPSA